MKLLEVIAKLVDKICKSSLHFCEHILHILLTRWIQYWLWIDCILHLRMRTYIHCRCRTWNNRWSTHRLIPLFLDLYAWFINKAAFATPRPLLGPIIQHMMLLFLVPQFWNGEVKINNHCTPGARQCWSLAPRRSHNKGCFPLLHTQVCDIYLRPENSWRFQHTLPFQEILTWCRASDKNRAEGRRIQSHPGVHACELRRQSITSASSHLSATSQAPLTVSPSHTQPAFQMAHQNR